jgi:ribose/xylose/arabinose/galactoside ABC-type transport system permease subunit
VTATSTPATDPQAPDPRRTTSAVRTYGLAGVILLVFCLFAVVNPAMLKVDNLKNIVSAGSLIGIMAVLSTFVILTGGIDLSVGAIMGLSGLLAQSVLGPSNTSTLCAVGVALLTGAVVGLVNGTVIARFGLPAIVVTLGTMTIVRGIALLIGGGSQRAVGGPPLFLRIGGSRLLGLPLPVCLFALVALTGWALQSSTRFGFSVYAIGENVRAARLCGLPVARVKTLVYIISGAGGGLAGLILSSQTHTATAVYGTGYELNVIAAVVVGGTSLFGGRGSVLRSVLGTLLIGVINNGLNIINVPIAPQLVAQGIVIVVAVAVDQRLRRDG